MSLLFDGVDDQVTFAGVDMTFGTALIVARIVTTNDTSWQSLIETEASGTTRFAMGRNNSGNLYSYFGSATREAIAIQDADNWCIFAITKTTGTTTADHHKIPIGGSRTTTASSGTAANAGTGATITRIGGNDDPANIRVAAAALFPGTVLTTTQLDGIASAKTTQSIYDLTPSLLCDDSNSFATNLMNGASSTITGTTDDADDPSGWVYFGGGATVSIPSLVMAPPIPT